MNEFEKDKIIRRLKQFEELSPPPDLTKNIMSRIRPEKKTYWQRFFEFVSTPQTLTLRPISLLTTTFVLAITFGLGMLANSPNESNSPAPSKILLTENAISSDETSFQIGKGLFLAGLVSEALPFLDKASRSKPGNPEYAYWQGLGYSATGKPEIEQASYLRGLESSPESIPLLLNLGHSLLEQKKPEAALQQYKQVIAIDPKQQAALYNQTLVYRLLQDESNEKNALKTYLENHRIGSRTFRAVERLNNLSDFSYRTYQLGRQKVILSQEALLGERLSNRFEYETELLSSKLLHNPHLLIDIVIFSDANEARAKNRAKLIRDTIVAKLDSTDKKRIRLSWFGEAETIKTQTENHHLQEGILLFGQVKENEKEETEI